MANKRTSGVRFAAALGEPCTYCQRTMTANGVGLQPTRDHVHPRSKGGLATVWACWTCNNTKGDMTLQEWQHYMDRHPRWWARHPVVRIAMRHEPAVPGRYVVRGGYLVQR